MSGVKRFWLYTLVLVLSLFAGVVVGGAQYRADSQGSGGDDDLSSVYALVDAFIAGVVALACVALFELGYRLQVRRRRQSG